MYGSINWRIFIVKLHCVHTRWNHSAFATTREVTYLWSSWNILDINRISENPNDEKNPHSLNISLQCNETYLFSGNTGKFSHLSLFCTWAISQALTPSAAADHTTIHPPKWALQLQTQKQKHTLADKSRLKYTCVFGKFSPKNFISLTVANIVKEKFVFYI